MHTITDFFRNLDYTIIYVILASIVSITLHEMSHGFAAYKLGDVTAKQRGRLSLNPLRHIDPVGIIMLIFFRFGWAKPVPVDMRYFKHPKRDMAITALAGPISNILVAFVALVFCALLTPFFYRSALAEAVYTFFNYLAVISVGLGIFNLIPIPPLDGSKVLFSLLPDRAYFQVLRYERFGMILLIILLYSGVFTPFLNVARQTVINLLWSAASLPLRLYYGI